MTALFYEDCPESRGIEPSDLAKIGRAPYDKEKPMNHTKTYTHVVWDFNGTVLDDVQLGIDCVNEMLEKRGLAVIPDVDAYRHVFGFPIDEYYRRLGFDFDKEDYDTVLAPEWVRLYLAGEGACPMNAGVAETLKAVRGMGLSQIILSASKVSQLEGQLARLGIRENFDEVLGLDNIHARSKAHLAIAWQEAHPEAVPLFLGDTVHDADVAGAIGADCVLFAGGHQPRETLEATGLPVIREIRELLAFL